MEPADRYLASLTVEGRYRLLMEAVTDYAIYLLDPSGIVTTWNPGAQRFKGYTADEIIGQPFSRFYTEEDQKAGLPGRALETARHAGWFEEFTAELLAFPGAMTIRSMPLPRAWHGVATHGLTEVPAGYIKGLW